MTTEQQTSTTVSLTTVTTQAPVTTVSSNTPVSGSVTNTLIKRYERRAHHRLFEIHNLRLKDGESYADFMAAVMTGKQIP